MADDRWTRDWYERNADRDRYLRGEEDDYGPPEAPYPEDTDEDPYPGSAGHRRRRYGRSGVGTSFDRFMQHRGWPSDFAEPWPPEREPYGAHHYREPGRVPPSGDFPEEDWRAEDRYAESSPAWSARPREWPAPTREDFGPGARHTRGPDETRPRGWWERARDELRSWLGDEDAARRREMDSYRIYRTDPSYARGPRGYKRSDSRILEDVSDRLAYDWDVDATDIEVSVKDGVVTLDGTVDTRQSRRRAEYIAADVWGVRDVQNNLRVREMEWRRGNLTGSSSAALEQTTGTSSGTPVPKPPKSTH